MASWAPAPGTAAHELGDAAKAFDDRVRAAFADDLGMPAAVVIVNELDHSADVPDADKYALLASWDRVLSLDLEREARSTWEPTLEMQELMTRRDEARARKDYATSDALRDQLTALGVEVKDTPEGTRVRPHDA
jgi:cysteinyl-tRNA synthetase